MSAKILNTGGAYGCDIEFEMAAIKAGYTVKAFSFAGHTTESKNRVILSPEQLNEACEKVADAAQYLNRKVPLDNYYVYNLLRRNWFQVKDSEVIYAVSVFEDNQWDKIRRDNGGKVLAVKVAGGTGWAVAMALLARKTVCVYDQNMTRWFQCFFYEDKLAPYYIVCPKSFPHGLPEFPGSFAGIGTRKPNANGVDAIKSLFRVNRAVYTLQ